MLAITPLVRERIRLLDDVLTVADFFFVDELPPYDPAELVPQKGDAQMALQALHQARQVLAATEFNNDALDKSLRAAAQHGGFLRALEAQLPPHAARLVEELAPSHIRLPGRRNAPVHYRAGQAPWVASRLQDFFGMRETPRVASGKVPLVVHLLAPSQRPVQTTTDLEGFWKRLYPQLRRELGRRYPRHAWPEDPLAVHRE
jgi:HrpA-like RNA helicase